MAAYEQIVHEHSVKILNQENIIQALKRVQVTGLAALKSQKDWADDLQRQLEATRRSGGGAGGEDCDDLRERLQEKDEEIQRLKGALETDDNEELRRLKVRIAELEAAPSDMIHQTEYAKDIEKANEDTKIRERSLLKKQLDGFKEGYISRDDCDKLKQSLEVEVERLKERYGDGTGKISYDEVEEALNNERHANLRQKEVYEMGLGDLNAQVAKQRTELQRAKDKIIKLETCVTELTTKNESAARREKDLAAAKQKIGSLETETQKLKMYFKAANGKIAQVEPQGISAADPGISSATACREALKKSEETIEALKTRLKSPSAKESDCEAALKDVVDLLDTTQKALDANDSIINDLVHGQDPDSRSLPMAKKGRHDQCANPKCEEEKIAYCETIDRLYMKLKLTGERLEAQLRTLVSDPNYGQSMRINNLIAALTTEITALNVGVQSHPKGMEGPGIQNTGERVAELSKNLKGAEKDLKLTKENCAKVKKDPAKKSNECQKLNAELRTKLESARKAAGQKSPRNGSDDEMIRQAEDAQLANDIEEKIKGAYEEEKATLQRKINRRDDTIEKWRAVNRTYMIKLDAMKKKYGEISQEGKPKQEGEKCPLLSQDR